MMAAIEAAKVDAGDAPVSREAVWRAIGVAIVEHITEKGSLVVLSGGVVVGPATRLDVVGAQSVEVLDDGVVRITLRPPG